MKKPTPAEEATDIATLASASMLIQFLESGIPFGETPATVAEFIDVHSKALDAMRQRVGKGAILISLDTLQRRYPIVPQQVDLL